MFSESTEIYDAIYCAMKDYAAEARMIGSLIRLKNPAAHTVLDVACGTGEHARHLAADHGFAVDGIDLDAGFVTLAQCKNPAGRFERANMIDFDLGRRYDAVICMFSSIGYVLTLEHVTATLSRFAAHLAPGGVVIVEPWFRPDSFHHGRVHQHSVECEGFPVARMGYSTVEGRISTIHFEYLIGGPGGIARASEDHALGLFTTEELRACFAAAGLTAEYDPVGPMNRGLFVARGV